jgi:single-strand DNA-binding protein
MAYGHINFVNLIGEVCRDPQIIQDSKGKKSVRLFIETKEAALNSQGNLKFKKNRHTLSAWGKWQQVIEEYIDVGCSIAIEGRLLTRCFQKNGTLHYYTEIEINDLTIL